MMSFGLISGVFMGTTLPLLAAHFSKTDPRLLYYWAVGKGFSAVISSITRIISLLAFHDYLHACIFYCAISVTFLLVSQCIVYKMLCPTKIDPV
jgi:hypothetical protein